MIGIIHILLGLLIIHKGFLDTRYLSEPTISYLQLRDVSNKITNQSCRLINTDYMILESIIAEEYN
jgi:hypothetical protein